MRKVKFHSKTNKQPDHSIELKEWKRFTMIQKKKSKGTSSNSILNLSFKKLVQVLKQVQIYSYLYFIQTSFMAKPLSHTTQCIYGWWLQIVRCTSRRNYTSSDVKWRKKKRKKKHTHKYTSAEAATDDQENRYKCSPFFFLFLRRHSSKCR